MRLTKFDEIVSMAKIKLASLPYLRDEDKMKFEMKKMNMRDVNKKIMTKTLGYFRWHNLLHDVTKLLGLIRHLDHEESEIFDIDLRRVDNTLHAKVYMYGVGKYYCGLDILPPMDPLK